MIFFLQSLHGTVIKRLVSSRNFAEIWKRCSAGIIMLVFIIKAWISGGGWSTRPEIGANALVLFLRTHLTGFLFSWLALGLGDLSFLSSVITLLFLMRMMDSLASSCKLNLLQGRLTLTNSKSSSLLSNSKSLFYTTTPINRLIRDLMGSAITKFECVMLELWLGHWRSRIGSWPLYAWVEIGKSNLRIGDGRWYRFLKWLDSARDNSVVELHSEEMCRSVPHL